MHFTSHHVMSCHSIIIIIARHQQKAKSVAFFCFFFFLICNRYDMIYVKQRIYARYIQNRTIMYDFHHYQPTPRQLTNDTSCQYAPYCSLARKTKNGRRPANNNTIQQKKTKTDRIGPDGIGSNRDTKRETHDTKSEQKEKRYKKNIAPLHCYCTSQYQEPNPPHPSTKQLTTHARPHARTPPPQQ